MTTLDLPVNNGHSCRYRVASVCSQHWPRKERGAKCPAPRASACLHTSHFLVLVSEGTVLSPFLITTKNALANETARHSAAILHPGHTHLDRSYHTSPPAKLHTSC